ncbi:MAG: GIY-YIG nuclease family protein [Patescibacteria group bacterium]|nr:GIY-YIG nuclease family protein [Patescibacteria group bacterium]
MHYVYVIKSLNHDFVYIGQTCDLKLRFPKHNAGKEIATKAYVPYKLIYYEAYASKKDALVREKKLKQFGSSWGHLMKRIANCL